MGTKLLIIQILIILFNYNYIYSNQINELETKSNSKTFTGDEICVQFEFQKGDSLIYTLIAFDSISINYDAPLIRKRTEKHLIICDSINQFNRYNLSHIMLSYESNERNKDTNNVIRTTSAWLGEKVSYEIDGAGKRYSYSCNDSSKAILSPGGAFTPFLFNDIGIFCQNSGDNWIVKETIEIPENGIPFPLYKHTSLFRFQDKIDTLNYLCDRIEYSRTGTGNYKLLIDNKKMQVTNNTNGFGLLDFSQELKLPIHYFQTQEQKLKINKPNGDALPGYHYTTCYFKLTWSNRHKIKNFE